MFWYMAFATFVCFCVKGISGFASSLAFGAMMTFRSEVIDISPISLMLNTPANVLMAWDARKIIDYKVVVPLSALVILGNIPGAIFLKLGDAVVLKILFGCFIMFLAIEMFLREHQKVVIKSSPVLLVVIGVVSGISSGLFGVGALLAAYISRTTSNMAEFRGNISAVFLVDNIFRMVLYSVTGILNLQNVTTSLCLMPFMGAGLALGMFGTRFVPEKIVKLIVELLLFASGFSLIITNVI